MEKKKYDFLINIYKTKPDDEQVLLWMSRYRYYLFHEKEIKNEKGLRITGMLLKGRGSDKEETYNTYRIFHLRRETIRYVPRLDYFYKYGARPYPSIGYKADKQQYVMEYNISVSKLEKALESAPPYPRYANPRFPPSIQILSIPVANSEIRFITDDDGILYVVPHDNPLERINAEEYQYPLAGHIHEHIRAKLWLGTLEKYGKGFELKPFNWGNGKKPSKKVF